MLPEGQDSRVPDAVWVPRDLLFALGSSGSLEETARRLLDAACRIPAIDAGGIYLRDPQTGALNLLAHRGLPDRVVAAVGHYPADSPQARLALLGRPAYRGRPELLASPDAGEELCRLAALRALAVLPVQHEGRLVATLNLASHTHEQVPPESRRTLEAIAACLGGVIARIRTTAALRESEERLGILFESAPDACYLHDLAGVFVDGNRAAEELVGCDRRELIGRSLLDLGLFPPPDLLTATKLLARCALGQPTGPDELALIRRDGTRVAIEARTFPVRISGRQLVLGIARDITARKEVERGYRQRAQQLEALRATSQEIARELELPTLLDLITRRAVDLVEAGDGLIRLWDEAERILVPKAMTGSVATRVVPALRLGEGVAGTAAQRREGIIVNDFRSSPYAIPLITQGSSHTAVLAEPLLYRDRLVGVITIDRYPGMGAFTEEDRHLLSLFATQAAIAIENARGHEAAVRRSAELEALLTASQSVLSGLDLQAILDRIVAQAHRISAAPHVKVVLVDREANALRVGAARGTGQVPGELMPLDRGASGTVARTGRLLFSPNHLSDPVNLYVDRDRQLGLVTYLGLPIKRGDEVLGVLTFNTTVPKHYRPDELAYLGAFADQAAIAIENARLFEAQQRAYARLQSAQEELVRTEKLRALGQMAAGVAHDLNNMLAAILGQTELLRLRVQHPEVQDALRVLYTAASDGAQVVRRLQEFGRRQPTAPLLPCDLEPIVREALELTRPRWQDEAHRHGRCIQVSTALDGLPRILGRPAEIREALTNLILNAVDALPDGGTLALAGHPGPAPVTPEIPAGVCLTVTDSGTGMPEEVRRHIFDPFYTTKGLQGTGLGLAVVYGIMERHGGRIDVASAPGEGTTFTLRFQAALPEASPCPGTGPSRSCMARRLLLIDDEAPVRTTLAGLLRAVGHSVEEAASGPAGLACLAAQAVDLVITDLGMPEMTGWEVARRIKAACRTLPVILLTGWGRQVAGTTPGQECVDRILGKPVRLEELQEAIAGLLPPGDSPPTLA